MLRRPPSDPVYFIEERETVTLYLRRVLRGSTNHSCLIPHIIHPANVDYIIDTFRRRFEELLSGFTNMGALLQSCAQKAFSLHRHILQETGQTVAEDFVLSILQKEFGDEITEKIKFRLRLARSYGEIQSEFGFLDLNRSVEGTFQLTHEEFASLKREIERRLIVNMVYVQGTAGYVFSKMLEKGSCGEYKATGIQPTTFEKAREFFNIGNLLHFTGLSIYDLAFTQSAMAGFVKLLHDPESGTPIVNAFAIDPFLLLYEAIKGIFETVALHSLPKDQNLRRFVLSICDKFEFELAHIPVGPVIFADILEKTSQASQPGKGDSLIKFVFQEVTDTHGHLLARVSGL
ncbi:MAG: hypothetical protein NZT61_02730 [Deltaproteobacteria bacterium]|nr:hypothetical protein [Deltaproteobacteria bacterium]